MVASRLDAKAFEELQSASPQLDEQTDEVHVFRYGASGV